MPAYVNEDKFYAWYTEVTGRCGNESVLQQVFAQYCRTGKPVFTLPAARTVTGKPEQYEFRFENIGSCGASTMFLYF